MEVGVRCESARATRYVRALRRDSLELMRAAGLRNAELSIVIVGDPAIRRLNRRWRGKDRPTDVLSFSQLEEKTRNGHVPHIAHSAKIGAIGDVIISIDTAASQAKQMEVAVAARLRALLVHGFLHLLGYDHERSDAEARRMFRRERRLIAILAANNRSD